MEDSVGMLVTAVEAVAAEVAVEVVPAVDTVGGVEAAGEVAVGGTKAGSRSVAESSVPGRAPMSPLIGGRGPVKRTT